MMDYAAITLSQPVLEAIHPCQMSLPMECMPAQLPAPRVQKLCKSLLYTVLMSMDMKRITRIGRHSARQAQ